MKKKIFSLMLCFTMLFVFSTNVFASTTTVGAKKTWNYTSYSNGSYVPKTGWAQPTFYKEDGNGQNTAKTYCQFTLDNHNVTNITQYNNGTNPNDDKELFLGIDITSERNGTLDQMDAYAISTSLPDPKTDLESDDAFGTRNEEAEVVALGTVSSTTYFMSVMWYDYRDGDTDDNGQWKVQFNMSGRYIGSGNVWIEKPFGDYNNVWTADDVQAIMSYGKNGGMV